MCMPCRLSERMSLHLEKSTSIKPRASPDKFASCLGLAGPYLRTVLSLAGQGVILTAFAKGGNMRVAKSINAFHCFVAD